MRLTPNMETALRLLYAGRRLTWRPTDIPGGAATTRALLKRGLVERCDGPANHICITEAGEAHVRDRAMAPAGERNGARHGR